MKSGDGVHVRPVPLAAELGDMVADLARERCERGSTLLLAARLRSTLELVEGCFGVDDDVLSAREVHDHVRTASVLARLARVVDSLLHADELEDPLELDLAPAAPRLRAPEGDGERPRPGREKLELRREPSAVLEPTRLGLVDELPEISETLLHRHERLLDALAGLYEKRVTRCGERLLRDAAHGLGQLLLQRREPRRGGDGAGAGLDEVAARDIELRISSRKLLVEHQLATIELRSKLPALGEGRSERQPADDSADEPGDDGGDDGHEDQAT